MTLVETLRDQERAWNERPLVRAVYTDWHRMIAERLSQLPGDSVELGAGIGKLAAVIDRIVLTDIVPTPWTTRTADAEALPFSDSSLANLVLVDVFHHLSSPAAFFAEAQRVLKPHGRVVIVDPYCSPVSTVVYSKFHHERTDLRADPFGPDHDVARTPLDSNQARATLAFFRARADYRRRWPELELVEARRFAVLAYPLSGGFSGPSVVPRFLAAPVLALDRVLTPLLAPVAAFRCLAVLERT